MLLCQFDAAVLVFYTRVSFRFGYVAPYSKNIFSIALHGVLSV